MAFPGEEEGGVILVALCLLGLFGMVMGVFWWRRQQRPHDEEEPSCEERLDALKRQKAQAEFALEEERQARRKLEQEVARLRTLDQAKTRFFENIAHEFRTPLTLIKLPLQEMRAALAPDASAADEHLGPVLRNTQRLERLVGHLYDLSRLEAEALRLRVRLHDFASFLHRMVDSFQGLARSKNIQLTVELSVDEAGRPVLVYYDADKMETILSNLLSNALAFTPAGGAVTVFLNEEWADVASAAASSAGVLSVEVRDTGIGIAADALSKLFGRYYQAVSERPRPRGGAGIGLALTRELVMLHGGELYAESTLGKGSSFRFTLPRGIAPPAAAVPAVLPGEDAPPPAVSAAVYRPTVFEDEGIAGDDAAPTMLVVEDNPEMRAYLGRQFTPYYNVVGAADGMAGLEQVRKHRPALVLADVMTPGEDGLELCRRIKEDVRLRQTPVILISANVSEQARVEGLEAGADDYVMKPFSLRELRLRVRKYLGPGRATGVAPDATPHHLSVADRTFLDKLRAVVLAHVADQHFSVDELAGEMALGRRQLQRKVNRLTGETPLAYIRAVRLERARQLLREGTYETVAEVAAAVGFSRNYFYRLYREQYSRSASDDLDRRL